MPTGRSSVRESRRHDQIRKAGQVGEIAPDAGGAAGHFRRRRDQLRPTRRGRIDDRIELVGREDAVEDRAHQRQRVIAHRRCIDNRSACRCRFADHQRPPPRIRAGAVGARRVDAARPLDQLGDVLRILRSERLRGSRRSAPRTRDSGSRCSTRPSRRAAISAGARRRSSRPACASCRATPPSPSRRRCPGRGNRARCPGARP